MKNKTIIKLVRDLLKDLLSQCTEGQQLMFKRMYSHNNLELPINDVIDKMDPDKLDWAVTQTEESIKKNNEKLEEKYK